MSQTTEFKVQQLLNTFGTQLDKEVLESVLEVNNGDLQSAKDFLMLQGAVPENYYNPTQDNSIPSDYMTKPYNWVDPVNVRRK
jgi:hypothetical protein